MPENQRVHRPPLAVPIILIVLGALFLYANYRPAFDPWLILKTYWPLILIFVGLAKIFDSARARQASGQNANSWSVGATVGVVAFVVVFLILALHGHSFSRNRKFSAALKHE